MKWYVCVLLLMSILIASSTVSHATTIVPATLESMTDVADTIVVGKIKSQKSYWEEQKIYTDIVIEVQEFVKNSKNETASEITLKVLGGTVGDKTLKVDMAPVFKVGEKVLLFLEKTKSAYVPLGLSYGVCNVTFDEEQQQEFVNGLYFQYSEHIDLKTMTPVPVPMELQLQASEEHLGKELGFFLQQVKSFVE